MSGAVKLGKMAARNVLRAEHLASRRDLDSHLLQACTLVENRLGQRPSLVLMFDVNETILLADPAGGDTFEQCLNKVIAKCAFVSEASLGSQSLRWWDGTNADGTTPPPPVVENAYAWPDGAIPFYEAFKDQAKRFTEKGPGVAYRPHFDELYEAMTETFSEAELESGAVSADLLKVLRRLRGPDDEGNVTFYYFLVPSFWQALVGLAKAGHDLTLVVRTFGTDSREVKDALDALIRIELEMGRGGEGEEGEKGGAPLRRRPPFGGMVERISKEDVERAKRLGLRDPRDTLAALLDPPLYRGRYDREGGEYTLRRVLQGSHNDDKNESNGDNVDDDKDSSTQASAVAANAAAAAATSAKGEEEKGEKEGGGEREERLGAVLCEEEVAKILGGTGDARCIVLQDDYPYWKSHDCRPEFGKPLLVDESKAMSFHPIFFDDNIKCCEENSIVAVRKRSKPGASFAAVSGRETASLHGLHLVRAQAAGQRGAVLDKSYFERWIELCIRRHAVEYGTKDYLGALQSGESSGWADPGAYAVPTYERLNPGSLAVKEKVKLAKAKGTREAEKEGLMKSRV